MRFLVLSCLICIVTSCRETTSFQIEGTIQDQETLQPVQNATVSLGELGVTPMSSDIYTSTITDEEGSYRLEFTLKGNCPGVTLSVFVEKEDYLSESSGFGTVECVDEVQIKNFWIECQDSSCD